MKSLYLSVCLSVCLYASFSEVLCRMTAKLGEGVRLGQGKTKFECVECAMYPLVFTMRGLSSISGGPVWMAISSHAKHFGGQFKVISCHPRSNPVSLSYGSETWWVAVSSVVEHFGGQFKVIRGHPRSNRYSLSNGSDTWWIGISSNADNFGGQFKVIRGHQRPNGLPMLYGLETWWVESSPDAENIEGHQGSPMVKWLAIIVWTYNLLDGVICGC